MFCTVFFLLTLHSVNNRRRQKVRTILSLFYFCPKHMRYCTKSNCVSLKNSKPIKIKKYLKDSMLGSFHEQKRKMSLKKKTHFLISFLFCCSNHYFAVLYNKHRMSERSVVGLPWQAAQHHPAICLLISCWWDGEENVKGKSKRTCGLS